jgi:hypothetical protein
MQSFLVLRLRRTWAGIGDVAAEGLLINGGIETRAQDSVVGLGACF